MAPWMRSSHMNQNRCWPGVPNRYKISPASRVTRPKSIATVVVVLSGTWDRSSTPVLAAVIAASPALPWSGGLELAKSTEHPFEQVKVRATLRVIQLMNPDQSFHRHVG